MTDVFIKINNQIQEAQNILLVTHPRPDGDALGSICAMMGYLKSQGKNYLAFCADKVPKNFQFLPWQEELVQELNNHSDFKPDLVIALDLSDWERSSIKNFLDRNRDCKMIVLDHHHTHGSLPDLSVVNIEYSSTVEIIYQFFKVVSFVPDKQIANCLLTGLLTDTENFTNPAARSESLAIAGELMRLGADFDKLTQKTQRFREFEDLKLIGLALDRLKYNQELGLAVTVIQEKDLKQLENQDDPLRGLTNFLKGLVDAKAVLVLKEQAGQIKGSFRSVDHTVDVAKLSAMLGGGGHKLAAGFSMDGHLEQINNNWQVT
jgi:bifunctional oligoribonuclease and PAP phosphatase NrnA